MNSLSDILHEICQTPKIVCAITVSVLLLFLLRKNFKFVSSVTSLLIPLASFLYILMCICVIIDCIEYVPYAFVRIFDDAFQIKAGIGGFSAIIFSKASRFGIMRGLITNESGCGTAPIAHSQADTDSAVRQGFWCIFEVVADTFILCSLSAIVILTDPLKNYGPDIVYILRRFTDTGGSVFKWILCACIALFAFATLIGWSQYGIESLLSINKSKKSKQAYIIVYALLATVGSVMTSSQMWDLADITVCTMTLINSFYIFIRFKEVKLETDRYFKPHGRDK
jgi:AGCS family alanine or glycine:cation symporter